MLFFHALLMSSDRACHYQANSISPTRRATIVLRPLYRTTCFSRHHQLRTGGFAGAKA